MKRVLIVQWLIKQYRVPFYTRLRERLWDEGVDLTVAYSPPPPEEERKGDNAELPTPWGVEVPAVRFPRGVLWQSCLEQALGHDLVIVEQAARHLLNYLLLGLRGAGRVRLGLWGHGRSQRNAPTAVAERLKRVTLVQADWWFAYTQGTADYVIARGMPAHRVTTVQNSVDVAAFRQELEEVNAPALEAFRARFGIGAGHRVALFCGGLYEDKHLPFLLEAADRLRARIPGFHLVVVGSGPLREWLDAEAVRRPGWLHATGPLFGAEKATCFRAAEAVLNPGLVGLAILDAFAAGLPMATTSVDIHSPEIEYLEDGFNGLVTEPAMVDYVGGVTCMFTKEGRLAALSRGAAESSHRYSIDTMVENFTQGVLHALRDQ